MEQNKVTENTLTETKTEFPEIDLKIEDKTKKKKKIKPWVIGIILVSVLLVGLVIAFVVKMSQSMTGMGTPVEVSEIKKGDIAQLVETSGFVEAEEVKTYFADVTAKVATLDVKAGQTVKAGDLLLTYDTTDLEERVKQAQLDAKISTYGADAVIAGIDHGQKKALDAATNYEDAKKYVAHYTECVGQASAQLNEASELAEKQASLTADMEKYGKAVAADPEDKASKKALKKAEKEYKEVTSQLKKYDVNALKATLEACSGDLAEYKALMKEYELSKETDPTASLNKAQQSAMKESAQMTKGAIEDELALAKEGVKSEFNGVVSEVSLVPGQTVTEGSPLFTIHNTDCLKVVFSTTKYEMTKLAIGQKADVVIGDNNYQGSISNISKIATLNASGTSVMEAEVHIDNPDDTIILGMDAKITIHTAQEKGILLVPMAAVNYSSKGVFCYVLVDGIIEKREIETGISDDEFMQVISGLSEGDKVVTNVTGMIQEGMKATEMKAGAMNGMGMPGAVEETEESEETQG